MTHCCWRSAFPRNLQQPDGGFFTVHSTDTGVWRLLKLHWREKKTTCRSWERFPDVEKMTFFQAALLTKHNWQNKLVVYKCHFYETSLHRILLCLCCALFLTCSREACCNVVSQDLRVVTMSSCWGSRAWAFYTACNDAVLARWHLINSPPRETKAWTRREAGAASTGMLHIFACAFVYTF